MWHPVEPASDVPIYRDLRLAVIENGQVHALVLPCRCSGQSWVDADTKRRVEVYPTHWQEWADSSPAGSRIFPLRIPPGPHPSLDRRISSRTAVAIRNLSPGRRTCPDIRVTMLPSPAGWSWAPVARAMPLTSVPKGTALIPKPRAPWAWRSKRLARRSSSRTGPTRRSGGEANHRAGESRRSATRIDCVKAY